MLREFGGHPPVICAGKRTELISRSRRRQLIFEQLERRELLALVSWVGGSGAWGDATHWDNAKGPATGDDALINVPGISVTHSAGTDVVKSLTLNDPFALSGGTLIVIGNLV